MTTLTATTITLDVSFETLATDLMNTIGIQQQTDIASPYGIKK